jgi:hypothetical protein
MNSGGGLRVKIYQTPDASSDQVTFVIEQHGRLESPKHKEAERVAEDLLKDHPEIRLEGETSYSILQEYVKSMTLFYNRSDITQLVSKSLHEKGIRVWK